jgi:hypothetical protein
MDYLERSAMDEQIVKMPRTEVYLKGVQHVVDVPYRYIEIDKTVSEQLRYIVFKGTVQRDGSG